MRDRMPVLIGIHVSYTIQIPEGTREMVDKALARHVDKCPTAQSLNRVTYSWVWGMLGRTVPLHPTTYPASRMLLTLVTERMRRLP